MSEVKQRFDAERENQVLSSKYTLAGVFLATLALGFNYYNTERSTAVESSFKKEKVVSKFAMAKIPKNPIRKSGGSYFDDRILAEKTRSARLKWTSMTPKERSLAFELQAVTPEVIDAWEPQHEREGNGWHEENGKYSGGLNFLNESWVQFGGTDFAPTAAQAEIKEQIAVGRRIQASVGDYSAPDPNDGTPGW